MDEHGRFTMDEDALELMLREDEPMTVREAFEAAYAPIPEGATCHVGYSPAGPILNSEGFPDDGFPYEWDGNAWSLLVQGEWGPDISDRPASAFLGFFGERYDEVVG